MIEKHNANYGFQHNGPVPDKYNSFVGKTQRIGIGNLTVTNNKHYIVKINSISITYSSYTAIILFWAQFSNFTAYKFQWEMAAHTEVDIHNLFMRKLIRRGRNIPERGWNYPRSAVLENFRPVWLEWIWQLKRKTAMQMDGQTWRTYNTFCIYISAKQNNFNIIFPAKIYYANLKTR